MSAIEPTAEARRAYDARWQCDVPRFPRMIAASLRSMEQRFSGVNATCLILAFQFHIALRNPLAEAAAGGCSDWGAAKG
jgi:hypothetical protein